RVSKDVVHFSPKFLVINVAKLRIICVRISLLSRIKKTAGGERAPLAPAIAVVVNAGDKSWVLGEIIQLCLIHSSFKTPGDSSSGSRIVMYYCRGNHESKERKNRTSARST